MRFRFPFVTMAWNDAMRRARDAEHEEVVRLREALERERDRCDERCATAEARVTEAQAAVLEIIVEVRGALKEAAAISKLAAHALFAVPDGEVPEATSVGVNDRRAAERIRAQQEQGA